MYSRATDYLMNTPIKRVINNNTELLKSQHQIKEKIFNWLFNEISSDDYLDNVFGERKSSYLLVSPHQQVIEVNGNYYSILFAKRSTSKNKLPVTLDTFTTYTNLLNPCYTYYVDYFKHQVAHTNVIKVRAFVVDIDFVLSADAMKIGMALKQGAFPIQPSYVVNSGTGIHFIYNIQDQTNDGYTFLFDQINNALQDMVKFTLQRIGVLACTVDKRPITQAYRFPGTKTKLSDIVVKSYVVSGAKYSIKYLARHLHGIYGTSAYRLMYACSLKNKYKRKCLHRDLVERLGYDPADLIYTMRVSGWNTLSMNAGFANQLVLNPSGPESVVTMLENTLQSSHDIGESAVGEMWYGNYHKDDAFLTVNKKERRLSRFAYFVRQNEKDMSNLHKKERRSDNVVDFVQLEPNKDKDRRYTSYYVRVANKEDFSDAKIYGVKVSFISTIFDDDLDTYEYRKDIRVEHIWVAADGTKRKSFKPVKAHIDRILKWIHLLVQDEEYLIYNDRDSSDLRDRLFVFNGNEFKDNYGEWSFYYDLYPDNNIEQLEYKKHIAGISQLPNTHANFFYGIANKILDNLPVPGFRNKTFFVLGVAAYKTKRFVDRSEAEDWVLKIYKALKDSGKSVNFTKKEALIAFEGGYDYKYGKMSFKQMAEWMGWERVVVRKKVIKSKADRSRIAHIPRMLRRYGKLYKILRLLSEGYSHSAARKIAGLSSTSYYNLYRKDPIMKEFDELYFEYNDKKRALKEVFPLIKKAIKDLYAERERIYEDREEVVKVKYVPRETSKEEILPTKLQSIGELTENANKITKRVKSQVKAKKTVKNLKENSITYFGWYVKFFDKEVESLIDSEEFESLVNKDDINETKRYFKWKREMKKCWEEHKDDWVVKLYDGLSKEVEAYIYDDINPILNKAIRESAKAPSKEERDKILKKANKRIVQIRSAKRREILLKRLESLIEKDKIDDFLLDKKQILRYIYN